MGYKLHEISGCLITHEHKDHAKAIADVIGLGIKCWSSNGTIAATGLKSPFLKVIQPLEWFAVGSWMVYPVPVKHDAAEPMAYVLYSKKTKEKLLFATDTSCFDFEVRGLTHILIEANHCDKIIQKKIDDGVIDGPTATRIRLSHMSIQETKALIKRTDLTTVKYIGLIHLSDTNSDAAAFKNEIESITGIPVLVAGYRELED